MKNSIILAIASCILTVITTTQAQDYVRYSVNTPEGQANLQAMNVAFEKMRQLPCDDPRSWYYQGAIHNVPDNLKTNPLCASYTQGSALKTAWDNCTHDGSAAANLHFLLWHRLYTAHFEAIVRKLSGKADFTLPYWNYVDPNQQVLPTLLGNTHQNSALYTSARLSSLNAGKKIAFPNPKNKPLDITTLMQQQPFTVFSSQLESAPHGAMHNYIGGGYSLEVIANPIWPNMPAPSKGLMAEVATAGFDPVFWLHHAEVDHIWSTWDASSIGSRPALAELQQKPWDYTFFDENGQQVNYSVAQAYQAAYNPDYRYDDSKPVLKGNANTATTQRTQPQAQLAWRKALSQKLSKGTQQIRIAQPTWVESVRLGSTSSPKSTTQVNWSLNLTLKVIGQPNEDYEVYLLQDGKKSYLGLINFFGITHVHTVKPSVAHSDDSHHDHHVSKAAAAEANNDMNSTSKQVYFDITPYYHNGQKPFTLEVKSTLDGNDAIEVTEVSVSKYQP